MGMHRLFVALACSVLLFPIKASCELEARTFFDDLQAGMQTYKRPKLILPPGWIEHETAGQEIRGIVLIRAGQADPASKATIYATAALKTEPTQKLHSFIVSNIDSFRKNSNRGRIVKAEKLRTGKGEAYTYTCSYRSEGKQYTQTVAYTVEDNYFLSFVLTGRSKQAHDNAYLTFKELLARYN